MTENETILINLIRNHKVPEKAIVTAIEIILLFLQNSDAVSDLSENGMNHHWLLIVPMIKFELLFRTSTEDQIITKGVMLRVREWSKTYQYDKRMHQPR